RQITSVVRREMAGGMVEPDLVGGTQEPARSRPSAYPFPVREPSPAEKKRRQQQQDLLEGQLSQAGVAGWVSDHAEEAGQCTGWVSVATDARAKRVSSAELELYRKDPAKPKAKVHVRPDHPLRRLLECPNPRYDLRGLLYRVEMQLCLTGTALIWAPKNGL